MAERLTPEEWASRAVEAMSDGLSVADVFRAAMQEALEMAAQYVMECNTPHHGLLADGIRALLQAPSRKRGAQP